MRPATHLPGGGTPPGEDHRPPGVLDRVGMTIFVVLAVVTLSLATVSAAGAVAQYLRLTVLDDYHDGYALGTQWRAEGERRADCNAAMSAIYGPREDDRGWNAFLVGCEDARSGASAVPWYSLRGHLRPAGD